MARGSATPSLSPALILLVTIPGAVGIGCFVCSSFDGNNRACEDPFNSTLELATKQREAASIANYHHPCWAFKKGRQGLFPADHCIKIIGHRAENVSKTMIIRTCALDSGTLTADTEIVRISHCGHFKFEGHHYTGCVQACDSDGCNSSDVRSRVAALFVVLLLTLVDLLRP
ncbi:hypothetical protein Y032_0227g2835 [Ancylostoma ceylanicum]|uniref:Protein quiver n=1 Tax=Ancylostoma ceylanicum TaxID=53326 RepID=A0A016SHP2_9BILA|nr:hypothetical protein Y032_0227g2835 [Ancylostoma ceylanicum]